MMSTHSEGEDDSFASHTKDLQQLKKNSLYRKARIISKRDSTVVEIDGKRLINFCSNDYLGLATHPRITSAINNASNNYGVGSGASPLICGKTSVHLELEEKTRQHDQPGQGVIGVLWIHGKSCGVVWIVPLRKKDRLPRQAVPCIHNRWGDVCKDTF